ncbi:MAG TPA: PadR family transcriptional regulator [Longimicrobiales bacterium]|nr:PadR family transcriptional regulator [Longimicrobiales bacterium]
MQRTPQDLLPGSLDALILKSLEGGARHGYGISRWVRQRTHGVLGIEDAALYKALHRLADRGCVSSAWGRSDLGRRAKLYELTEAGRQALASETNTWRAFALAVHRILETG